MLADGPPWWRAAGEKGQSRVYKEGFLTPRAMGAENAGQGPIEPLVFSD